MKAQDRARIAQAIAQAEEGTTGTIAVRVLNHKSIDALEAAKHEFSQLGLHRHPASNAALILVAPRARRYAVIGDRALHEAVGEGFWKDLTSEMRSYMVYGQVTEGILHAVARLGEAFRKHFAQEPAA